MKGNENMNENVTLDGYFDEAREYIEANAKNEIQTERLSQNTTHPRVCGL